MSELWRLSAVEAVERLRRDEVTPLELIDDALDRIAAVGPAVNAFVTLCPERAREHARRLMARPVGARGPLAGLPVGVKDLTDVAGVRTTYGSPIYADHVPERSDVMIERLEANGGIVVGKTNTPEFGAGANTFNEVFGETLNPWDTRLNAGGSSGGSAVALATGQVWLATGSDLGGSLRTPAAFCAVVGMRPSPGVVGFGPREARFDTLSVNGPMGRDVADTALLLDALVGDDREDPISLPASEGSFLDASKRGVAPGRVAVCLEPAGLPIETGVLEICRAAVERLAGGGIESETASPDFDGVGDAFKTLRAVDFAAAKGPLLETHRDLLKPDVIWNIESAKALRGDQVGVALRRRSRLYTDVLAFFERFDVLVLPAAPILPRAIAERWPHEIEGVALENYVDWLQLAAITTMTGCPVLALPAGFSADGRPMGIQIVGRPRGEADLLGYARVFEDILGVRDSVPIDPRVGVA